ncbi:MAG: CRISPR-associated protein [Methanobacteriota archaeon]|nr:MAG: CRISPR-associated protein [Euryarchaeota archaeon]
MKKYYYTLTFYTDWLCSSGLDSGVEADALPIKDVKGLPFVPGKTIKGLFRQAAEEISDAQGGKFSEVVSRVFGIGDDVEKEGQSGSAFFSNATLPLQEASEIVKNNLQQFLFRKISSTAIDNAGLVKEKTLRTVEVCIPVVLTGEIVFDGLNEEEKDLCEELLKMIVKWVRCLGSWRNRGFGRCRFELVDGIK